MAERLTAAHAARNDLPELKASSAGVGAVIGHPIHPDAAPVLERLGGDSGGFAARQITPRIAGDADLILTMTRLHRDRVLELAPHRLHRTYTLGEASMLASEFGAETTNDLKELRPQLAGRDIADVADPIGQSSEVFERVGDQIARLLQPVFSAAEVAQPGGKRVYVGANAAPEKMNPRPDSSLRHDTPASCTLQWNPAAARICPKSSSLGSSPVGGENGGSSTHPNWASPDRLSTSTLGVCESPFAPGTLSGASGMPSAPDVA